MYNTCMHAGETTLCIVTSPVVDIMFQNDIQSENIFNIFFPKIYGFHNVVELIKFLLKTKEDNIVFIQYVNDESNS